MEYFLLIIGFALLAFSGDLLVRGSVGLANRFHISSLVIGMTVVSFGTSAPELFVSAIAAINGSSDIAVANVIGSNISNIGLVLGITAMLFPLLIDKNTVKIYWPVMMLASLAFIAIAWNYEINRLEGFCFISTFILFIFLLLRLSKKTIKLEGEVPSNIKIHIKSVRKTVILIILGCAGLVLGAHLLVDSAITIAKYFNLSERIIGVSIIAFGTSLPELATSCMAAFRKQAEISVGNLIGSNIFNILAIVGITAIIKPITNIDYSILHNDILWMIGISVLLFPLLIFGKYISRFKGIILIIASMIYYYLVLK